jgi:Na+-translocating ferredoxin:NAD+ oxidoreductase RnfA subunit
MDKELTNKQAYNMITDVVTGINVRKKDNFFQIIFVFISVLLGAAISIIFFNTDRDLFDIRRLAIGIVGGFIGLIVGIILSGIFLMLFRAIMHLNGKHD